MVEVAILRSYRLSWAGGLAVVASLAANLLALAYGMKRKRWAYELFKWIAAFSLVWTIFGGPYLYALGLWANALIALCVWLRFGAVLMLRRKAAREWIDSASVGGYL
ncbi:hypothetical protein P0D88_36660 [Paraburkholderia sp. RL18-103-BIB-C]|uniref:hypothetical protein n=1 Tax=Paraburkholderia sp. RL18-103-BIB-C TaxID=3031637 RepID=UPI0038B92321